MKAVVIYCSNHGTTEKVAGMIAEKLRPAYSVTVINLLELRNPDVSEFELVVIGGSIHFGTIQKQVKQFCENNEALLKNRKIGLFLCCMLDDQKQSEFNNAFPESLRTHSKANGCLGGEFLFDQLNFLEKLIVKKVAKTDTTESKIDYEELNRFIASLSSPESSLMNSGE